MARTFTATLSASSIRKLQKDLEKYKSELQEKAEKFAEALAEEGVEIAKMNIAGYDAVFTGELINSIHVERTDGKGVVFAVVADSAHAIIVELGTGQRGLDTPYPHPLPEGVSWSYAVGRTIRQNKEGRYYWFYPGQDGQWHYTEGLPARPYMHDTAMELYQKVESVAKRIFES